MHFAGTGSKAGTMFVKVNTFFNMHLLTVNEYFMLSTLIKRIHILLVQCYGSEAQKHTLRQLF